MGRSIVITSGKGGVGKTTATLNIGAALALKGAHVMLVDTDIGLRNLDVENNAWMVAYAPYDNPKIVVVVYIQNGYAAGNCGHAVGEVVKAYLDSLEETPSMAVNEDNTLAD